MPTAAAIPVINAALTRTGDEPITSFDEGTPQAAVAALNYDEIVNGLLASYPWKFASRTMALAALDVIVDPPWHYAYERPSDVLDLRVVLSAAGQPIDYELLSDKILTLWEPPVTAKYTYRVQEPMWPKYFGLAVIATLEPLFLRAIGERYDAAEARQKQAINLQAAARNRDSQSQTPRQPVDSPMLRARAGWFGGGRGARGPWRDWNW